jgi:glycosyltransferase involved in cell wall biosynthesis
MHSRLGVIAIGRNEGDRLVRCLTSVTGAVDNVVYVDSGSVDGSIERARGFGVSVVELDQGQPFTAARARNAGFEKLISQDPEL